jgi:subtilisin family serine protease
VSGRNSIEPTIPEESLVFFPHDMNFDQISAEVRDVMKLQALSASAMFERGAQPRFDEKQVLILDRLRVGIFPRSRESLEQQFDAERVISNLQFFLPRAVASQFPTKPAAECFPDEGADSWGRQAVRASGTQATGRGVKVCVIDTGLQFKHADFKDRFEVGKRGKGFTVSEIVSDSNGHGTHCAGIICGPAVPASGKPRYGVAPDVDLFVANVFGGALATSASLLFQAVEWALSQHCDIASVSLQRPSDDEGNPRLQRDLAKLEGLAQRALAEGMLMVACTGNSSDRRNDVITPAAFPASCPSVLAVGGVDRCLKVMNRSNSDAELFAPGEDVLSTSMSTSGTGRMSGTSMAAAFVSGVAALHCETTALRGAQLLSHLKNGGGLQITLSPNEPAARLVEV